jgi:uncharacterized membrane protein (DUF2068 family)
LREDTEVRLIIAWKLVKLTALVVAASLLLGPLGERALPHVYHYAELLHVAPVWLAARLTRETLVLGAVAMLLLACVYGLQAWGLHLRRAWADWLVLVPSALLIPLEVYRLARVPHAATAVVLLVNVGIVLALGQRVRRRHQTAPAARADPA